MVPKGTEPEPDTLHPLDEVVRYSWKESAPDLISIPKHEIELAILQLLGAAHMIDSFRMGGEVQHQLRSTPAMLELSLDLNDIQNE